MNLFRNLLTLLLLSCGASVCIAQETPKGAPERPAREMIGTSLARNTCKSTPEQNEENVRICKGVEGYSLLLEGDEKKPQISLLAPDGGRHPIQYWDTTDPGFLEIDPSPLWLVVHEPAKTIAIDFRLKMKRTQENQWGHHDVIVRVSPVPVCIVASLPASPRSSSEKIVIATSPENRPCLALDELHKRD